ncbi:helix-turn-helix transcriptional regulator [Nocardioides daejeonensis]|uniref:helix-turn-helix transcriptional regulator n=1 Tax=Nocardioides daejeonensis TaxID=1046556 RepID=UPI000D74C37F|nr:WYL domain-containing protein [Nocardioides daejeonensis]
MATPGYVSRIARLPQVLAILAEHRDGMPIAVLAATVGVREDELREDLLAYFTADPIWTLGLSRPTTLEFLGPDGTEDDPNRAELVRVISDSDDLGVELLDADELALIHTAAMALLDLQPDDEELASAVEVLTETMLGVPAEERRTWHDGVLSLMQDAAQAHRVVRIEYSRAWHAGVTEREIHPLRLVQTRRGWEVDAGPVAADGGLRTYLLGNVRSAEVLEERFEPPPGVADLLTEQRALAEVRVQLPHEARWAADMYAESVRVADEDESTFTADLLLLEPVAWRVGLLALVGGEETRVLSPVDLISAGPELARELLAHHEQPVE